MKIVQVRMADQAMYHQGDQSVFATPRYMKKENCRSFTSIQMLHRHTHTHPAGAGSTLKGKRKKKADTNDGQKDKTAQGGKGTNGPPKPTYTERRA